MLVLGINALEHGCVLQHIRYNDVPDPAAPDVYVLQLAVLAIPACCCDIPQLAVPVVLCLLQLTPVHLAGLQLYGDGVALRFMQQLDGDAYALEACAHVWLLLLLLSVPALLT